MNDFNPKAKQDNWIKKQEPNHKKWNDILAKELERGKDAFRKLEEEGMEQRVFKLFKGLL